MRVILSHELVNSDIFHIFSRVLRDSTPRYVSPSVGWLVGRSPFYFFGVFELFEHTAPAQMP